MEYQDDNSGELDTLGTPGDVSYGESDEKEAASPQDKALVLKICQKIKADKKHHEKAFKRMRRDQQVATWGAEKDWGADKYRANITGRLVKQKTASLYAKNPRVVARRRETLDFQVWDESADTLKLAYQTIQMAQMAQQQPMQVQFDQATGMPTMVPPELPPGFDKAMAVIQDFQQGMERRQQVEKTGKTMEILFAQAMREQKPLDFKQAMKSMVRRTITTCVGYVELGFQREYGPRPGMTERLADSRARLAHLENLIQDEVDGDIDPDAAERAEMEHSIQALMDEPEILLREGLIFDFPQSTKVIPDKLTKSLKGFIGARHVTVEYAYSVDEVKELFGVDVTAGYTPYNMSAGSSREISSNDVMDEDYEWSDPEEKKGGMVCVWKHYDKTAGLVYYIADGYCEFLRPPAAPDVKVEDFWPIYAFTINDVENEEELYPPSDVSLMLDMQKEHNRARQGKREHREAARPRWVFANGAFGSEDDPLILKNLKAFEAAGLNIDPQSDIKRVLQTLPVPGVDPNLYDTGETFADTQLVVGTNQAQLGGMSKSTATESAISASASSTADGSAIDDLDEFLTVIARGSGQIMLREYSPEKVFEIAGPGAVWPDVTIEQIADEVFLEVEAGSTGKPNQAVEVANMQRLAPLMMQIPGMNPEWFLKEMLRRMDDRLDVNAAIAAGIPSIAAMNQQQQISAGQNPNAQGPQGAMNAPQTPQQPGSMAAMGGNQTEPTAAAGM
jgi:hypothetical protein